MYSKRSGFTLVELLLVIVIIAILAAIVIVSYGTMQNRASTSVVVSTTSDAAKKLQLYYFDNDAYPSNFADTNYTAPQTVGVALYTNAPQAPVYSGLSSSQNAQLFLNVCNGLMPIVSGGTTYNTSCEYNGNSAHIKGQAASNVLIHGPTINSSDFVLTCGSMCTTARNQIISVFQSQGGTFPITVPSGSSSLPAPSMVNTGKATKFCVEVRGGSAGQIVYHSSSAVKAVVSGACPNDPTLHYP